MVQWGVATVHVRGSFYEPADDGELFAIIAPCVFDGELVDLCAVVLPEGKPTTRCGAGWALGEDEIERARWEWDTLRLVDTPLQWLREPRRHACVIDWRIAHLRLADIGKIVCDTLALGERVLAAFEHPPIPAPLVSIDR